MKGCRSQFRNRDIRMQENGLDERKLEKVREESYSFKRRIICNWKLLKESLTPVEIIDPFISQELVAADLWDYIRYESRRSQMDLILRNVVKNIETSDDYDKFGTIVTTHKIQLNTPRDELFIPEQRRLADIKCIRVNRELIEKELYPKDHIDSFLEWFILSIEDHEALRNKENIRKQMANLFFQNITKPISIQKGAMACLFESFKKDNNRVLMHLVKLFDAGISYFIDDEKLQALIEMRDGCRNSIISKWTYLKENFYPQSNLIDELCSGGLVDEDRAEIIKDKPRREQVYLTLRNIIRRIDGPEMFSKLVSILEKESSFIAEKLEETSHKLVRNDVAGAKNCFYRNQSGLEDTVLREKLHQIFYRYKDDIAREFYPTDVDTFMDKLVFDVDDHEIICETGNDEKKKAWNFYEKISDTKYIQKGSFDCLVFCLRNNEKLKKSRQALADLLLLQHTPKQVKNRTAIASRATDGVLYPENTSQFTEGELKLTVDDLGSKDKLEHEIFKVVESSEYQDKEIDGLKIKVKNTKRSSVVIHLKSNGENVKLIVEKGIVNGDLSSFIRNLLDDENIKVHMIPGHKYTVSVSLHSKNQQKIFSGVHGSRKMRILKANRELLEEEYDPMPLLKSVLKENVKYKSVADLSPQYINEVFQQFREISKVPERRKRVTQFMDIAECMIDADTLWGLIEDTANAFSVKKLRDDLNDANSGQKNIKLSAACSEEGLVFKGRYEVWITEEDVKSPLQSMILEANRKQDVNMLFESMHLETRREKDEISRYRPAFLEKKWTKEEESEYLEDEISTYRLAYLEEKWTKEEESEYLEDEISKYHPAYLEKKWTKEEEQKHLDDVNISFESMDLETRQKEDVNISFESMDLETRQKEDLTNSIEDVESMYFKARRKADEEKKYLKVLNTFLQSMILETREERDEKFQYESTSLHKWLTDDLNNDVKLWIKTRVETLSRLNDLKDELLEANKKIKRETIARSLTLGLALVGGALFSVYTGGLSMAGSTLIAGVFTTGAASIILLIKEYVKSGVLRRTQLSIYEDQTATHHLKIKVLRLGKKDIPFADNLRKIKLKGIEDLAKVPLEQLISRFVDTESSSLLTAVDKISEIRVILEQELQEISSYECIETLL